MMFAACHPSHMRAALVALATAWLACSAHAQELTGTLKKVHDDGIVLLGVREASIPFSYFDGHGTVGYSDRKSVV